MDGLNMYTKCTYMFIFISLTTRFDVAEAIILSELNISAFTLITDFPFFTIFVFTVTVSPSFTALKNSTFRLM